MASTTLTSRAALMWLACLQAMEEIVHAAHALDKRPDVKAIIITGDGAKAFAAGADILEMADQTYDEVSAILLAVEISSSGHVLQRTKVMTCQHRVHPQACFVHPQLSLAFCMLSSGDMPLGQLAHPWACTRSVSMAGFINMHASCKPD